MKSIFGFLLALLASATLSASAQTAPAAQPAPAAHAPKMHAEHMPAAAPMAGQTAQPAKMKMAKAKPAATMMPGGPGPMKKDGTPDMRYKANRMAKGKM